MANQWYCKDNSPWVTAGADVNAVVIYGGVIQRDDHSGGYNVRLSVVGAQAFYHVHFNAHGTKVNALRYFAGASAQGNNIVRFTMDPGQPVNRSNLQGLASYCKTQQFPNHEVLLRKMHAAIANVPRLPSGELT